MRPTLPLGLYGVADATYGDPLVQGHRLIDEGLQVVQLRCKGWSSADRAAVGRPLAARLGARGGVLIMNDDLEAALACGAQGLHLGQGDGGLAEARARLPPQTLLGRSTHTPEQVAEAVGSADYLGFGPLFGTSTKETPWTPRAPLLAAALTAAGRTPVVGIGGIGPERLPALRAAGLRHWAVISAIHCAPSLASAVAALR
ncbi:MAG: thiamine phosphate synthase [Deltaproteobacteria bacterium]|nr:thiamine phosphate synthase [Deltaproteobacteria bacterium]